jgi:hypothetical protein
MSIAVFVFEPPDAIGIHRPFGHLLLAAVPAVHGVALFDGLKRQVVFQPVHVPPVIFDAPALAEGLSDVDPSLAVKTEGDRVRDIGLGGNEFDGHPGRRLEALDRQLRFL